ncbi:MAG: hypothetical protein U1F66_05695 [bacterium]
MSDYYENKPTIEQADKIAAEWGGNIGAPQRARLTRLVNAAYAMIILSGAALILLFLIKKIPIVTALGLLIAGIVPGIFIPTAFMATSFLILAGLLALFVKKKAPAPA